MENHGQVIMPQNRHTTSLAMSHQLMITVHQLDGLSDMHQAMVFYTTFRFNLFIVKTYQFTKDHKIKLFFKHFTDYDYDFQEPRPRNPIKSSHDDPWLHIHKEEAARSALLFGVGVLKGVAVTALINNANNGVTIGK